ncbi:MAG: response regulator transcription factor [Pedobacter sp.]|nr:MAG: response regulator transcription factor [Pedobacter sp.]
MLNAIIVDDEELARSSIYFLIQENCPEVNLVGIAKSVEEARELLLQIPTDLIFLDIAMPGENGFELIPQAQAANASVIFTTAYDQYALKAIKASAVDYLLKPIDIDELKTAVAKVLQIHKSKEDENVLSYEPLKDLEHNIANVANLQKITVPFGPGYQVLALKDIMYLDADSNYSVFHMESGDRILVSKILKEYEEILPEGKFVRIHKSTIVNIGYVKEYQNKNGFQITLYNGEVLPVSRRRVPDFLEKIKAFTSNLQNEE